MAIFSADTPVGYELPALSWRFHVGQFKKADEKTIHTDDAAAQREGLPAAVAVI